MNEDILLEVIKALSYDVDIEDIANMAEVEVEDIEEIARKYKADIEEHRKVNGGE